MRRPQPAEGKIATERNRFATHLIRLILLGINQRLLGPLLSQLYAQLFEFLFRLFGCQGDVLRLGVSFCWTAETGKGEG